MGWDFYEEITVKSYATKRAAVKFGKALTVQPLLIISFSQLRWFGPVSWLPQAIFPLRCAIAQHHQTICVVKSHSRAFGTFQIYRNIVYCISSARVAGTRICGAGVRTRRTMRAVRARVELGVGQARYKKFFVRGIECCLNACDV